MLAVLVLPAVVVVTCPYFVPCWASACVTSRSPAEDSLASNSSLGTAL